MICSYRKKTAVAYKVVEKTELKGDLYLPNYPGKKPAVLVIHGGGWDRKSGDMKAISYRLAMAGFVVFNFTYRLAAENLYPKAVEDVRDAAQWLFDHADEFQVDREKMGAWGYSAGGHLSLLVGLNPKNHIKAIAAGGAPADLTTWPESPIVSKFIGGNLASKRDLWIQASPVNHVREDSPPVYLYHGEWDLLVGIDQMEKMQAALESKKIPTTIYRIPLLGHVAVYVLSWRAISLGIQFMNLNLRA
jgi:acetyl esterase/lipase